MNPVHVAVANHFIYRYDFQKVGNETVLLSFVFNLFVILFGCI